MRIYKSVSGICIWIKRLFIGLGNFHDIRKSKRVYFIVEYKSDPIISV